MTARGKAYSENIIGVYVKFLSSLMEQFHAHGSFEKLRREAAKCSGTEIEPLYDKEMQEAMEKWNEANK